MILRHAGSGNWNGIDNMNNHAIGSIIGHSGFTDSAGVVNIHHPPSKNINTHPTHHQTQRLCSAEKVDVYDIFGIKNLTFTEYQNSFARFLRRYFGQRFAKENPKEHIITNIPAAITNIKILMAVSMRNSTLWK